MRLELPRIRYKLFRYRHVEQAIVGRSHVRRLLDIGCGDGRNLLRFKHLPVHRTGLEISWPRLRLARRQGLDVLQASGTSIPFPDSTFDIIYIAHVLHHVADYQRVLAESQRCLVPGGTMFLVETVTDHPLLRLGRAIHPFWQGDRVEVDWRYRELVRILNQAGWQIQESDRYNLIYYLWEMLPLAFWPFEIFSPIFICLDLFMARFFKKYSVHCYFVCQKLLTVTEDKPDLSGI